MKLDTQPPITASDSSTSDLLDPLEIIDAMLNLRAQLAEFQQQVDALQPAFYAACAALQLEKIATDRATISRRLTPGKWNYSDEISSRRICSSNSNPSFNKPMSQLAVEKSIG